MNTDTSLISEKLDTTDAPAIIKDFFRQANPSDLYRINARKLAIKLNLPLDLILTNFFGFVKKGILNLSWEYHCPHCEAVPDFKHNFHEVKSGGHCPICNVDFRNTLDENIEVTFTVHPSLFPLAPEIEAEYKEQMYTAAKEQGYKIPRPFLSGLDCLTHPVFQEMFGGDILSAEESLEINHITLLFTDIKGSTKMYTELGDAKSYDVVRDHFKILFKSVESSGGTVVKTIGDAVMAVFTSPEDALRAALDAYKKFRETEFSGKGHLEIKMGLHTGSAIAVSMNGRNDYFGNTVNTAARIQHETKTHAVSFSEDMFELPAVQNMLKAAVKELGLSIYRKKAALKGIGENIPVYSLRA